MLNRPSPQHPISAIDKIVAEYLKDEPWEKYEEVKGVRSGFTCLDRFTGGFQPGELTIVASLNSGSTCFIKNLALNIAFDRQKPVVYFSLEEKKLPFAHSIISMVANVCSGRMRTGYLSDADKNTISTIHDAFVNVPLFVNDINGQSVFDICRCVNNFLKGAHDVTPELIIIDYLQLIVPWGEDITRKDEICEILSELENLAISTKIPIVIRSLLYKTRRLNVEFGKPQPTPILADFMCAPETALIDNYADKVFFIDPDRHDFSYGESDRSYGGPEYPKENTISINVVKNPNGILGNINLKLENSGRMKDHNSA